MFRSGTFQPCAQTLAAAEAVVLGAWPLWPLLPAPLPCHPDHPLAVWCSLELNFQAAKVRVFCAWSEVCRVWSGSWQGVCVV